MSFSGICMAGLFSFFLITQTVTAKPVYQQAKIYFESTEELNQLKSKHLDIVGEQEDYLEIVVFPEQLENIKQSGFRAEVVIEDMTAFFQCDSIRPVIWAVIRPLMKFILILMG